MGEDVTVSVGDGVAEVVLNRPARKNALTLEMFEEIAAAGEKLKGETALRAVILSGAGGDFCSGLDLAVMQSLAGRLDEMQARLREVPAGQRANWFQKPCTVWQELEVPVIAAVEGVCLGGGMQLALAADFRIARADARLSVREAKWGMIPDMGITQSLPKLVRADQAKELMISARMLSGEEALGLGLVTRLSDDPLAAARRMAGEIAARPPETVAAVKRLVERTWSMPPGEGLAVEAELQAPLIGSPNQLEAVMAAMQKRAPKYRMS